MSDLKLELIVLYTTKSSKIKECKIMRPIVDGYYYISKSINLEHHDKWTKWVVSADWVPLDHPVDSEDSLSVKLDLGGLFGSFSDGPIEINPEMLTGAVIKVSKVTVFNYDYEGAAKSSLGLEWTIEELGDVISNALTPPVGNVDGNKRIEDVTLVNNENIRTVLEGEENIESYEKLKDEEIIKSILNSKPSH